MKEEGQTEEFRLRLREREGEIERKREIEKSIKLVRGNYFILSGQHDLGQRLLAHQFPPI